MIPHSSPWIIESEISECSRVLRSGLLLGGPLVDRAARKIEEAVGGARSFMFPSGRSALSAALTSLHLAPNSKVIVQTYVCDAVIGAIYRAGLVPEFCDVGAGWCSTVETVEARCSDDTAAILLTPPFGIFQSAQPFRKFGVPIVHDLCQAHCRTLSAKWDEVGDIAIFSFHPTKYLCAGGGGAAVSRDERIALSLDRISQEWREIAPFTELQAVLLFTQLERSKEFREHRSEIVRLYRSGLPAHLLAILGQSDVLVGDLFRFPLRGSFDFDRLQNAFAAAGVAVRRGVDQLAHRAFSIGDDVFPNAVRAFRDTLSLPFYPKLGRDDAEKVLTSALTILGGQNEN